MPRRAARAAKAYQAACPVGSVGRGMLRAFSILGHAGQGVMARLGSFLFNYLSAWSLA